MLSLNERMVRIVNNILIYIYIYINNEFTKIDRLFNNKSTMNLIEEDTTAIQYVHAKAPAVIKPKYKQD